MNAPPFVAEWIAMDSAFRHWIDGDRCLWNYSSEVKVEVPVAMLEPCKTVADVHRIMCNELHHRANVLLAAYEQLANPWMERLSAIRKLRDSIPDSPEYRSVRQRPRRVVEFNLNEYVYVRLTDAGRLHLRQRHDDWHRRHGNTPPHYTPPEEKDGWYRGQGWELMEDFGEIMGAARREPFGMDIRISLPADPTYVREEESQQDNHSEEKP